MAKTFAIPVAAGSAACESGEGGADPATELQLFTACYHYAQRWSLAAVVAASPGPPALLSEYTNTGNSAGSTHDFQVITAQPEKQQKDKVARPLFVAADEQSIRVFDLAKPRCIKKGLSGWVQQLLPATSTNSSRAEQPQRLVCTGASLCGQDSIWSVSPSAVEKVASPQLPNKGLRLIPHPATQGRYFGISDGGNMVPLRSTVVCPFLTI